MQSLQKKHIWMIVSAIILVVLALIFWLKPQNQNKNTSVQADSSNTNAVGHVADSAISASQAQSFASKSQQDIQINCQIRLDNANHLIVNEQTKDCFEFFMTQYGEKTIDQIKTDFVTYSKASYKEPLLSQLTDLWSRYIQYRGQMGDMQAPNVSKDDPKYYRTILTNMKNLRKKFFSNYEIEGLFGQEDTYNDYTLDRMDVMDDKNLSAEEKAKKLKELFNNLPEDWKENLQQLSQLEDLRKLTAEIKARGGSAEELRQMRTNLVGPEATQRLENLDVQRNDWKQRVDQYLSDRDGIMKSSMSDSAKQSAVEQLRTQQFNSPQDKLRVQTFETVHDQGGKLPYGN